MVQAGRCAGAVPMAALGPWVARAAWGPKSSAWRWRFCRAEPRTATTTRRKSRKLVSGRTAPPTDRQAQRAAAAPELVELHRRETVGGEEQVEEGEESPLIGRWRGRRFVSRFLLFAVSVCVPLGCCFTWMTRPVSLRPKKDVDPKGAKKRVKCQRCRTCRNSEVP